MAELTHFLVWLVVYAVSGGFWHFVAVFLIIGAITRITTLVRINRTVNTPKSET